ncbi:hypothetical protein GLOIN_2v1828557 [Rhizophagus irregularis DAOM 181602=DAOM 197198]|nr:hypothetical protein GLOIN_2v1828557 [Rhizophagus irregularis DAOM 181602=DAOM 197198]
MACELQLMPNRSKPRIDPLKTHPDRSTSARWRCGQHLSEINKTHRKNVMPRDKKFYQQQIENQKIRKEIHSMRLGVNYTMVIHRFKIGKNHNDDPKKKSNKARAQRHTDNFLRYYKEYKSLKFDVKKLQLSSTTPSASDVSSSSSPNITAKFLRLHNHRGISFNNVFLFLFPAIDWYCDYVTDTRPFRKGLQVKVSADGNINISQIVLFKINFQRDKHKHKNLLKY